MWYKSIKNNIESEFDYSVYNDKYYIELKSRRINHNQYNSLYFGKNRFDKGNQLLKDNPKTRQAAISIYDAKEHARYKHDTPCTYAIQFTILDNKLNICVTMRSNDLWYGFCNDQYCFSQLQIMVADKLKIPVGTYYHFAHNLHLYNNIIEKVYE